MSNVDTGPDNPWGGLSPDGFGWEERADQRSNRQELSPTAAKELAQRWTSTSFGVQVVASLWSGIANKLWDMLINTFLVSESHSQERDVDFPSCYSC